MQDELLQLLRHLGTQYPQWGGSGVDVLVHHHVLAVRREQQASAEQFVQHTAERVQVGLRSGPPAAHLLGRHVLVGADGGAGRGQLRDIGPQDRRDPEVEDLHRPVAGDQDVAGFEVAVDDRYLVRVRQYGGDLGRHRHRPTDRKQPIRVDVRGQGHPVHQLHDQEQPLVRVVEHRVVHLRHAGVLDPRGDTGLTAEAPGELSECWSSRRWWDRSSCTSWRTPLRREPSGRVTGCSCPPPHLVPIRLVH